MLATALFAVAGIGRLLDAPGALTGVAFTACYAAGGWQPALAGLQALRQRTLDVDLLMVVAAFGAAASGQVLDGALLIVIFTTSGVLEAAATQRTTNSIRSLLALAPDRAARWRDGVEEVVDAADLLVGT